MENKRMNLKELRDALVKLPEDYLEDTAIALDRATSDQPDNEFGLMTLFGNNFETCLDFEKIDTKEIGKRLIEFLNKDLKQAKLSEEDPEYDDQYNAEGDW